MGREQSAPGGIASQRARLAEGPLLGREVEWNLISSSVDDVAGGRARTIFVEGEAGIGKTRLVRELLAHAQRAGFSVWAGRAADLEQMRPFGAIADGMARFVRELGSTGDELQDFVRELARSPNSVEATDRFVELIEELALSQPVCLVLEDLHWADPDTITAARALTRRLGYLPVLLAATYRPHPQSSELGRFVDAALAEGSTVIELRPLDDQAMKGLVARIVGGKVGPGLEKMLEAASGNPLYGAELAHALQEEGLLYFGDDGTADIETTHLPPTLRLTILRRLSQFPPDTVELLRQAAVLGSTFHLHELAALAGQPVSGVARGLEAPIAARIIEEHDNRLAFRHDLIHEAIYQDIPTPLRATQHVTIAGVMRSLGVPTVRIAEHMIRGLDGGDPALFDDVIALITELKFSAPRVAVALAEKTLTLDAISEDRRDELRRQVLWPLVMAGRRADAERIGHEMLRRPLDPAVEGITRLVLEAVQAEDGRSRDAIAALERLAEDPRPPAEIARLIKVTLIAILIRAGVCDRVLVLDQLKTDAREAGDALSLTVATGALAAGRLAEGRVAEAVRTAEEYLELEGPARSIVPTPFVAPAIAYLGADRLSDARRACREGRRRALETGEPPAIAVYAAIEGLIGFVGGSWDDALTEANLALELVALGGGSSATLVLALVALAQIAVRRDHLHEALLHLAQAEQIISEKGPQWGLELVGWTKALCLETSGDGSAALSTFAAAWDASASGHYIFGRPAFADLVRLAMAAGDLDRASRVTEEAEEARRRAEEVPSVIGVALRCRGLLDDDVESLIAAADAYRSSPRVVEKAAACEDAARSLARRGQESEARSLFEEALKTYDELEAMRDSSRVLGAMRSFGIRRGSRAPRRRPATGWDALTPTEVEVARLTVEGLTNPKIAARLFVSKYTVQTHLSHIFSKLQVSSRAELAVEAVKHQP